MVDRAENQNSGATPAFSRANWQAEGFLQAAKRARGEALRGMIIALVRWARSGPARRASRGAAGRDAMRIRVKH